MAVKCESCGHAHEQWVPADRLQKVTEQRREAQKTARELEAQLEEAQGQLTEAQKHAKGSEALAQQVEELRGQIEAQKAEHETDRALLEAGITDPEGRDVARYLYGRLDEEGRPPLSEWLGSFGEDRSAAPRALTPYLSTLDVPSPAPAPAEAQAGAPSSDPAPTQGRVMPPPNAGVRHAAPSSEPYSAEAIRRMSPEEYRQHRDAILATVKGGQGPSVQ